LREFLYEEERKGYVVPGSSEYTAPVFFVGKKDSSELRPVMDYRELNKWTIRDNNPLPNIGTALENLKDRRLFSKFDLHWGYKNIRIRPKDCHKAAFKTQFGVYILKVTYFGLTNAPPVFQRAMQRDLRTLLQRYPKEFGNYLDDVWIVTKDNEEGIKLHRKISKELFTTLKAKSYFLKLSKSIFEAKEMDLLGWRVSNGEVRINPDKIAGLREWPHQLKNVHKVRSTMGILGYHRKHIRGFAKIAKPILELTKKDKEFKWTPECEGALNNLIERVTSDPVLKCPDPVLHSKSLFLS
jgi:Reverse transcriptase (RNA-dependent DNA polymerase)